MADSCGASALDSGVGYTLAMGRSSKWQVKRRRCRGPRTLRPVWYVNLG